MTRVDILIDSLEPGGAEWSLVELLPALARRGIEPRILCLRHASEGFENRVLEMGFPLRISSGNTRWSRIVGVRERLKTGCPAVLHTVLFESDLVGRIAATGTDVRVISSLVNTRYDPSRLRDPRVRPWRLKAARILDGWTARRLTDHFHAVNQTVKKAAVEHLRIPPNLVSVIPRGRDRERLGFASEERRRRARRLLGLEEHQSVILHVGRQEYQKGQIFLLEAMSRLAPEHPSLVALIAGRRGHATGDLEERVRTLRLEKKVRFLGHREDVPELLAAADLFVLPSLYEGNAGALLEAMALELPAVVSYLPSVREFVEHEKTALLVPPEDSQALAAAIDRLLREPALARSLGQHARHVFDCGFSLSASASKMANLYRSLAGGDVPQP